MRFLVSLALGLVLLEAGSFAVLRLGFLRRIAVHFSEGDFESSFLYPMHPYTGLPMKQGKSDLEKGFTVPERGDEKVHVLLTGASVAYYLNETKREYLEGELSKLWGKTKLSVVAKGGLKQPQQLMALTYAGVLGRYPDIVVNLDGFNELAGALSENLPNGTPLAFPRDWTRSALRSEPFFSGIYLRLRAVAFADVKAKQLSRYLLPNTGKALRIAASNGKERALAALDRRARDFLNVSYERRNRAKWSTAWTAHLSEAVRIWGDSSELLGEFCKKHGIAYLHFLQPNQHLKGSKLLSEEEAAREDSIYAEVIAAGYPKLRERGSLLKRNGERFTDLTQMFRRQSQTIYTDSIGHLNEEGNRLLAEAVLTELRSLTNEVGRRANSRRVVLGVESVRNF